SFWGFQIDRDRFFVDVELAEIPGIVIGLARTQAAAGIAAAGVLDLDDFGAKPRQNLGAGRACLELGEVDDLDAVEKLELLCHVSHGCFLLIAMGFAPLNPSYDSLSPRRVGADEVLVDIGAPAGA